MKPFKSSGHKLTCKLQDLINNCMHLTVTYSSKQQHAWTFAACNPPFRFCSRGWHSMHAPSAANSNTFLKRCMPAAASGGLRGHGCGRLSIAQSLGQSCQAVCHSSATQNRCNWKPNTYCYTQLQHCTIPLRSNIRTEESTSGSNWQLALYTANPRVLRGLKCDMA